MDARRKQIIECNTLDHLDKKIGRRMEPAAGQYRPGIKHGEGRRGGSKVSSERCSRVRRGAVSDISTLSVTEAGGPTWHPLPTLEHTAYTSNLRAVRQSLAQLVGMHTHAGEPGRGVGFPKLAKMNRPMHSRGGVHERSVSWVRSRGSGVGQKIRAWPHLQLVLQVVHCELSIKQPRFVWN